MNHKLQYQLDWSSVVSDASQGRSVFTIIDGLDYPDLIGHARDRHPEENTGIYSGSLGVDLALHIPRLVRLVFSHLNVSKFLRVFTKSFTP